MIPELDANQAQIHRILQSKAFRTSEVHRNLLNYLAEKSLAGTAHGLKEYTVGLDVFAKPASYDPRQESVVRMHVGRLRQKLAEYYRTEGTDDPIVVNLPKGGFTLTFEPRAMPAANGSTPETEPRSAISHREVALAASLVVALACAGYFGIRLLRVPNGATAAASLASWSPELQQLWAPLLSSDRPLMIALATDPFHASGARPGTAVTGVGTANGAFLLGQFLGQRKHNVFLIRSDLLSMGEIAMGDVIFLGPTNGKRQIQNLPPVDQPFVLEPEGIRNLHPQPGESAFLADVPQDAGELGESHALISNLPGLYGNGSILYLSGNQVASVVGAVQALTDPDLARPLVARLKTPTGSVPRYYQIVLKVKAMDDTPIDIAYVFHRELSISKAPLAANSQK